MTIPFARLVPEANRGARRRAARWNAGGRRRGRVSAEGRINQDIRLANAERFARGWPTIKAFDGPQPEPKCCADHVHGHEKSKAPRPRHEVEAAACAEPLVCETDEHRWHRAYRLLDKLRPISRNRTAQCRRFRTSKTVQVFCETDRIRFSGLCTCGNVWGCPVCSLAIQIRRGGEIEWALDLWKGDNPARIGPATATAYMLTGTVRHGLRHKLADTSRVVADAWSLFFAGREGQDLRRDLGIEHHIRALEATFGDLDSGDAHGWHPHLHVVVMTKRRLSQSELERLNDRWHWAVQSTAGYEQAFKPNERAGFKVKELERGSDGKYLQKMFLELTATTTKKAKGTNLTYWEVAQLAANGDQRYARVWQEAQRALFCRKQLTWSHGSKKVFGLDDLTDETLSDENGIDATKLSDIMQIEIPGHIWDEGWRRDRWFGSTVVGAVRFAAQSGDYSSLLALLSERLSRQGGGFACGPPEGALNFRTQVENSASRACS